MVRCGFLFDIIIVRVDVPNHPIEETKLLSVDATFNNVSLRVTSSRINVVEFKPKRSFEFDSTPGDLKRDLSVCPLRLKVYYDNRIIGTATVPWSECVLDRITDSMGELTHIDECELTDEAMDNERVGTLEFVCRLQCKCEEPSDEFCGVDVSTNIRKHIGKIIDPNDILFVVAEPNKEDVCGEFPNNEEPSGSAKPTTALDLSPYRILNGRLIQTTDPVNTCQNLECCDLLKTSHQYQQLIDSLNPCQKKKKSGTGRMCQAKEHCSDCPHHNKFSSGSSSSDETASDMCVPCKCFAADHNNNNVFGTRKLPKVCPPPTDMPERDGHVFKTPRRCPVCKEDIRWLPKLATCPKCGYKPVPVVVEKPHDEGITADQVLQEYLNEISTESDRSSRRSGRNTCIKKSECRCTCTKGKVCANCRVRKLCEDIFKPPEEEEEDCGKCEEDEAEMFTLCKTSSRDCRPHLARVFSELKDLFDATEPKSDSEPVHEACERELNPPAAEKKRPIPPPVITPRNAPVTPNKPPFQAPEKRRKRLRKRRGQGRGAARSMCRPPTCVEPIPPRDLRPDFHNTCVSHRKNVPGNMGWLWNADPNLGPRWRPGAIRKPIKEIMRYFLRDFPADTLPVSRYAYQRHQGKGDGRAEAEELVQRPTLHICKKNGEIYITLRPLKNPEALKHCADPYLNMHPIQFKIVKNPLAAEISKMKRCLKEMGFNKCTCHKPVFECFCRTFLDKKRLEYQMRKECRKRGIEDCCDSLILSDTSESEAEYDFGVTPPAGLIRPERLCRADKVNVGTQYEQCDWNTPPNFPKPPNTFMKWINCATGHKFAYPRRDDLLTIGQKEAIACQKRKLEEAKNKKKKGKKGKAAAAFAALPPAAQLDKKANMKTCPDGTKVDMRKYIVSAPKVDSK